MEQIPRQAFRPDIQGLRAFAVLLVVLYHAGLPGLPGGYIGVDIFFVISGYLITNHLLAQLSQSGRISFASFYAKRARRILPAALLVIVMTLAAAWVFVAPLGRQDVFEDAVATALYVPNMLFAYQNTDYLAGQTPSLFQHYWSLGIEEQFYVFWPLIIVGAFAASRRSRRGLGWALLIVTALSFAAGYLLTTVNQPWAFFSLPTRAWELGVGGLVAFAATSKRSSAPTWAAGLFGWIGIIGLVAVAVTFDDSTVFPGLAAALPVALTAAVIHNGRTPTQWGPASLLTLKPMVFFGTISYSLYLLHWPALTLPAQTGGIERQLPLWANLLIVLGCIPAAYVMHRWVERPAQAWAPLTRSLPKRSLIASLLMPSLVASVAIFGILDTGNLTLSSSKDSSSVISASPSFTTYVPANLTPALRDAAASVPEIYALGCHLDERATEPRSCQFGQDESAPLVVLFGDSHAAQWFPALHAAAEQGTIRLQIETKSSCPSAQVAKLEDGLPYAACDTWRAAVIDDLNALAPDIILISNYARSEGIVSGQDFGESWQQGLTRSLDQLPESSSVFVLADSPALSVEPALCLSANLDDALACSTPRHMALSTALSAAESDAAESGGADYVDMNDFLCSDSLCSPIIGNVLAYRDSNHLTTEFVERLSDELIGQLSLPAAMHTGNANE